MYGAGRRVPGPSDGRWQRCVPGHTQLGRRRRARAARRHRLLLTVIANQRNALVPASRGAPQPAGLFSIKAKRRERQTSLSFWLWPRCSMAVIPAWVG